MMDVLSAWPNYVAVVAPFPRPGSVVEGWMGRIRAVDDVLSCTPRVYLRFDPNADGFAEPKLEQFIGEAIELTVRPGSEVHRKFIEQVITHSRFVYVHTVHLAKFVAAYVPSGKIVVDFHGAAPEEERMQGNDANGEYFDGVERAVISGSKRAVVVTHAMKEHLQAKYPDCAIDFIVLPIMERHDFALEDRPAQLSDGRFSVVYSGGTQSWQNIDTMLDAVGRAALEAEYVFLSHDHERIGKLASELCPDVEFQGLVTDREGLRGYYARADFGFVLRDDSVVNRVACPTKLIEYMAFGIVPIILSPDIGDFKRHGYQYITLEEFASGVVPSEHQRKKMMHLMSYGKSKSYVNLGSASAVYSGPSAGAGQKSTGR
jgi:glycosyltransferase involved in cell wall biosynthesis